MFIDRPSLYYFCHLDIQFVNRLQIHFGLLTKTSTYNEQVLFQLDFLLIDDLFHLGFYSFQHLCLFLELFTVLQLELVDVLIDLLDMAVLSFRVRLFTKYNVRLFYQFVDLLYIQLHIVYIVFENSKDIVLWKLVFQVLQFLIELLLLVVHLFLKDEVDFRSEIFVLIFQTIDHHLHYVFFPVFLVVVVVFLLVLPFHGGLQSAEIDMVVFQVHRIVFQLIIGQLFIYQMRTRQFQFQLVDGWLATEQQIIMVVYGHVVIVHYYFGQFSRLLHLQHIVNDS